MMPFTIPLTMECIAVALLALKKPVSTDGGHLHPANADGGHTHAAADEAAAVELFDQLEKCESMLAKTRFLNGNRLTGWLACSCKDCFPFF